MVLIYKLARPLYLQLLDLVLLNLTFEQGHFYLYHDQLLIKVLHLELVLIEHGFSFTQTLSNICLVQFLLGQHYPC